MTTKYQTVAAAEALMATANRDTWALADAVLADVPAIANGGDRKSDQSPLAGGLITERLRDLAQALEDAGVTTPNGDPYTWQALATLRETSSGWPVEHRHPEAAYRTHQDVGTHQAKNAPLLAALCAVARGETVRVPDGFDEDGWNLAVQKVRKRASKPRPPRFLVSGNDLRISNGEKTYAPPQTYDPVSIVDLLAHVSTSRSAMRAFGLSLAGVDIDDDDREHIATNLRKLREMVDFVIDVVTATVDQDALNALLSEGVEP